MTTINADIQRKGETAAAWTSANPVLLDRQVGWETDTGRYKVGDGVTAWSSLAYGAPALNHKDTHVPGGGDEIKSLTFENEGLAIEDTGGDHSLMLKVGEDLGDGRTLTITVSDADRTLALGANLTVTGATTLSGTPGYVLSVGATTYGSPADGATVYFGNRYNAPTGTPDITRVYIPRAGTIKRADILGFAATAGTNEGWEMLIRLNNTTDTSIQNLASASGTRVWSNSALSIPVVAGDYIEIKLVNPAWATNPLNVSFGGNIYIET